MLVAFDIGNSAVKAGLFDGDVCVQRMHFSTAEIYSPTGIVDGFRLALDDRPVTEVGCVSVVPVVTDRIQMAVQIVLGLGMTQLDSFSPGPLELAYETPETLGSDRFAAATAAQSLYGKSETGEPRSVIIVDAGTAVTCDFVSREGVYSGGSIGPGPELIRDALHKSTAQLPQVNLDVDVDLPATSTEKALQAGILFGFQDSVSGLINRLSESAPDEPIVITTGGWASWLTGRCSGIDVNDPDLVLHGVRILMNYKKLP